MGQSGATSWICRRTGMSSRCRFISTVLRRGAARVAVTCEWESLSRGWRRTGQGDLGLRNLPRMPILTWVAGKLPEERSMDLFVRAGPSPKKLQKLQKP